MVNRAHKKNKCVLCPYWNHGLKKCAHKLINPKEPKQWIDGVKLEVNLNDTNRRI